MEIRTVKLLGITIDNELKFDDEHLSNVYLKANRKLPALTRMRVYLDFKKIRILFKEFLEAQFKYCHLSWIFYGRSTIRCINHLHETALMLIYDHYELTFEELLKNYSLVIITILRHYALNHVKYTIARHKLLSTICLHETAIFINPIGNPIVISQIRTVLKTSNSIRYYGPINWSLVPVEIR